MQRGSGEKSEKRFCVVSFPDDEGLYIVSSRWLTQGKSEYICLWPPYKGDARIKKAVMEEERPSSSWLTSSAKLMKKCKTYKGAENFLKTVLMVSKKHSNALVNKERESIAPNNDLPLAKRVKIEQDSDASTSGSSSSSETNEHLSASVLSESEVVTELVEDSSTDCPTLSPAETKTITCSSTYQFLMENTSNQSHEEPPSAQNGGEPSSNGLEDFQWRVITMLEEMHKEIREMKSQIDQFCRSKGDGSQSLPEECPQLPTQSPEGLAEFNAFLNKKEHFDQICDCFAYIGGFTHKDIIRRILQSIMTNSLSMMYNWKGTGGVKLAFCQFTNVIKMISTSLRRHSVHNGATDNEIETCIKKWLIYAKDRDGGRAQRGKNTSVIEDMYSIENNKK